MLESGRGTRLTAVSAAAASLLDRCALYNPGDRGNTLPAGAGAGPRFLMGDQAGDFASG